MPLPIVICALDDQIGKPVSELLQPEFEVIHFIQSLKAAQSEIPHILAGRDPQSPSNNIGTKNYTHQARAIIFGRAFDLELLGTRAENRLLVRLYLLIILSLLLGLRGGCLVSGWRMGVWKMWLFCIDWAGWDWAF
ncbi:unnamed protein product [Penicillium salamii]|uniref:Uncharacterized protein n=1 Tax=Penicillium salamii TaxID=1612424 RepID=A0A9W4INH0_9EURO|nr:unnamed protein product [Penicillium salamii]CAG8147907.1 unnamed protein product [Penicillium salamii]CAG8150228.1 unnamed protein product [Penicillium salamii]CAG8224156.1 unnamed protein product [Penicillium salamii]CAG8265106.1 unnamed protein product [Penicillium salamii]